MIRIKLRLQKSDRNLQSYTDYCHKNESRAFAKTIGLSAYRSLDGLTASEIEVIYNKTVTKEKTWWLYKGIIPPSSFEDISFNRQGIFTTYSFYRNGREEFKKDGFVSLNKDSLDGLARLLPPVHAFDQVKAFCFCTDPSMKRHFHIRGGGIHVALSLDEISLLHGSAPENLASVIKWAESHREELIESWEEAVNVYYVYYPDKNTT